jgi:hypothetical protein
MADKEDARAANERIAIELQNKYHYYFMGLTFTVLALSIQTAKFGKSGIANGLELVGWVSLLVSALTGLSFFEWFAPLYKFFAMEAGLQKDLSTLKQAVLHTPVHNLGTGTVEKPADVIERTEKSLSEIAARRKRLQRWQSFKYRTMKIAFIAGIVCLMVSRGWAPLEPIAKSISARFHTAPAPDSGTHVRRQR